MENKMFTVKRYGAWWWIVINNETNLAVKKSDGTLLLFKDKESAPALQAQRRGRAVQSLVLLQLRHGSTEKS